MAKNPEWIKAKNNFLARVRYWNARGASIDINDIDYKNMSTSELKELDRFGLQEYFYTKEPDLEEEYEEDEEQEQDFIWDYNDLPPHEQIIIDQFEEQLKQFSTHYDRYLKDWLHGLMKNHSAEAVAQMIQNWRDLGIDLTSKDFYGEKWQDTLTKMMECMPEEAQLGEMEMEEMIESLQEDLTDWGDYR